MNKIQLTILSLLISFVGTSQDTLQPSTELKPMNAYIDLALMHSPLIKLQQTVIDQKAIELALLKYAWMREIYVTADTKYGRYGSSQALDQLNIGYGTGAFIRLPITAMVGAAQRKKLAQLDLEGMKFQGEVLEDQLKQAIIKQYHECSLNRSLIEIQVAACDVAYANYKLAEEEFKGGSIHIDAFSRVSEIYFTQSQALEKIKNQYRSSLAILHEMCGIDSL